MKLHFYEKEKDKYVTEFISEGELHFVKKVRPLPEKKKFRFFHLRR